MASKIAGRKEMVKSNSVNKETLCLYLHSDLRGHLGMGYFLMFSSIVHAPSQSVFFTLCQEQGIHIRYLVSMYLSAALKRAHTYTAIVVMCWASNQDSFLSLTESPSDTSPCPY